MNIAFLSSLNPTDIHNWSGTLYYMIIWRKITGSLGPVGSNWKKPSNSTGKTSGKTLLSHRRNMPGYSERC